MQRNIDIRGNHFATLARLGLILALIATMSVLPAAPAAARPPDSTGGGAPLAPATSVAAPGARQTLADLPAPAQAAISAAIGRDQAAYHATLREDGSLDLANPAQDLQGRFSAEAATVYAGGAEWNLRLSAWGYGGALQHAEPVAPSATANRVEYRRDGLSEWYVNGPQGLEQGFTLTSPPPLRGEGGLLTLALALNPTLTAQISADGRELTLLNRAQQAVLRYSGLTAYDATGQELAAQMQVSADALHLQVAVAAARYPITIDPWVQTAKLTAADGAADDYFGWSVAVSGDTVVVGAYGDDDLDYNSGSAYVFVKPGGGWATTSAYTAKLTASDGAAADSFGRSVAVSGDTVVVGAPYDDDKGSASGSAYVFGSAPAVCTAAGSGNWSDPATWSCGHMPGPGEAVVIPAGITVTLDQDVTLDSNLDVQGTLVPNGKTVTLTGSAAQTLKGSPPNMTFYNLVVNKTNATDVVTIDGKLKVTKKLTITKGKLKSASDYGDVEIGPAGTLELTSDVTVGGNWTDNGTFIHNNHAVEFDGTTLQTLDGSVATPFYRWVINATAQVAVVTVPTAADSVVNNGVLSQTQTVNNATVNFLQISTDKYRGVDIDATGQNLGAVTVTISGNHTQCTSDAGSPPYRNRCFRVNVGTAPTGSATMTFYTTAAEDDIATGDALYLYFFGTWADLDAACGAGAGDPCSKSVENLQAGDNYFLIGGADSPNAVTLAEFRAAPQFDLAAWLADLLRRLGMAR